MLFGLGVCAMHAEASLLLLLCAQPSECLSALSTLSAEQQPVLVFQDTHSKLLYPYTLGPANFRQVQGAFGPTAYLVVQLGKRLLSDLKIHTCLSKI